MTLPLGNRTDATGNNTTADYDYEFRIIAETDLVVTVASPAGVEETLLLTSDYTVDGVGDASGGQIHLVDNNQEWLDDDGFLDADWDIVIRRVRPLTQTTDIRNQGDFYPEVHEDTFDHLVMLIQQLQEQIDRCLTASIAEGDVPTVAEIIAAAEAAEAAQAAAEVAQAAAEAAAGTVTLASQAEAEAGTDNVKYLSSLRTKQAIAANAPVSTLTSALSVVAGAVATNAALVVSGGVFTLTPDASFTLSNPTNPVDGKKLMWRIKQDGAGSRILTLGSKFKVSADISSVVLSTTAGYVDMIGAVYNSTDDIWSIVAFAINITGLA